MLGHGIKGMFELFPESRTQIPHLLGQVADGATISKVPGPEELNKAAQQDVDSFQWGMGSIFKYVFCQRGEVIHKVINHLKPKILLILEIVVKRTLWHACCIKDLLNAGMIEPLEMDNFSSNFKDSFFCIFCVDRIDRKTLR